MSCKWCILTCFRSLVLTGMLAKIKPLPERKFQAETDDYDRTSAELSGSAASEVDRGHVRRGR